MKFEVSRLGLLDVVLLVVTLAAARAGLVPGNGSEGSVECDSIYLRFSPDHVMCQQKSDDCHLFASGINNTDKEIILNLHNRYRSQIAIGNMSGLPPASDMLELEWDDELATVSQTDANLCAPYTSSPAASKIEKFVFLGGGSWGPHTDSEDTNRDWEGYFQWMADKTSNIPHRSPNFPMRPPTGHEVSSLLALSKTWRMGCGFSKYRARRTGTHFEKRYICAYGLGASAEVDVYKVGPACSDCPEGTCCGASCQRYGFAPSFEGLCKITGDGPRIAIDEEDLLWTCQFNTDTQRACRARSEPAHAFVTKTFFATGYAEAVLQAGQSAKMTFEQIIRPSRGALCAVVEYSKGPNVAGQPDHGLFNLVATPVDSPERQQNTDLSGSSIYVLRKKVDLLFDVPIQIGFSFVVPGTSPSQFLNIRSVAIYDKACSP